jgi:hypothetical protein
MHYFRFTKIWHANNTDIEYVIFAAIRATQLESKHTTTMRKKLLSLLAATISIFVAQAQFQLTQTSRPIFNDLNRQLTHWGSGTSGNLSKTTTCSYDTINYTFSKATSLQGLAMNTSSGSGFSQWYPSANPITISGFEFYAWQSASTNAVVNITCRIFNASPTDSLPIGAALATVVVPVDSTFGTGALTTLRKLAVFPNPVTIMGNSGYVITVETSSATNVSLVANNWTASPPNGRSEWLSSVRFGSGWVRSYNVNVGGNPLNADFLMQPFVSFDIKADFEPSSICNPGGGHTINFTNTSSAHMFERFYNVRMFQNIPQLSFMWNYGDHGGFFYAVNGVRTYNQRITYTVTKTDTLIGWTRGCSDVKQVIIDAAPLPTNAFSNGPVCNGGTLQLNCDSVAGVSGYIWTGPNGFSSTLRNPSITNFAAINQGVYNVRTLAGQCTSAVATTVVDIISTPVATNNGALCEGQQLMLNVTNIAGATYTWTGPNGFSSSNINPTRTNITLADAGQYNVNVSVPGCGSLGNFTTDVIVNAVPTAPIASNNGPLCAGENLELNATNITGATFAWNGPNGFISNQQNPTRLGVNTSAAGTYSVTATINGCTSAAINTTVVVNNIPVTPTISSNSPLCVGQTLSLTTTPIANATYSWSGPANFSSIQQNPVRDTVQLSHTGQYSLIATVNGCNAAPATINVIVSTSTPSPVATNNGPICPGQTLQLSASSILGASYSWSGPNGFTSALQNPSISNVAIADAGLYSVSAISPGCGVSAAATTDVQVTGLPIAPSISSNAPLCDGSTLQLNAATVTGASYSWTGPNGFISTLQNPSITNVTSSNSGQYNVTVSVPGCGTSPVSSQQVSIRRVPVPPFPSSNAPVCTGDTIKFNALSNNTGPNRTFTWSGPNNFQSSLANPFLPNANATNVGQYTVSVSDSGCISAPAGVSINLLPIPISPIATNSGVVCEGNNIQLSSTTIVGAAYQWVGPGGFTSNVQNPTVFGLTPDRAGLYSVRAVVNGCLSQPANTTVIVNPLPTTPQPSNSGPVCQGQNISLTTDLVQGATYSWSGPNGFSSSLRSPVINNAPLNAAGVYEVLVTQQNCLSKPGKTLVDINSVPSAPIITTLPSSGILCAGDSLVLFASFVAGGSFEWTGPAGFGSLEQNPVIRNALPVNGGNYEVRVSRFGCTSPARVVNVMVNEAPNTGLLNGPVSVRNFETHTYTIEAGDIGSVFNWSVGGGINQSGGSTNTITVAWGAEGTGFVRARETNAFGCRGVLRQIDVTITNTTALSKVDLPSFAIYPNPANEVAVLERINDASGNIIVQCFNALGQLVLSAHMTDGMPSISLPVHELSNGVYLVKITKANQSRTVKLQVNH